MLQDSDFDNIFTMAFVRDVVHSVKLFYFRGRYTKIMRKGYIPRKRYFTYHSYIPFNRDLDVPPHLDAKLM